MIRTREPNTVIPYNATTKAGKAITHLVMKSRLHYLRGLHVETTDEFGGRMLVQRGPEPSNGEASLLLFAESLAGRGAVTLAWAIEDVDQGSARAMAEAVMIAAGLHGQTAVIMGDDG